MIIYGDILFVENFITGCVLLYITSQINGIPTGNLKGAIRIISGGTMCGLFSMLIFLMLPAYVIMMIQIPFAAAVNLVSSGRKNLLRKSITFILVTYFAGGITLVILLMTSSNCIYTPAAIYTGDMKTSVLMLSMAVCVMTAKQIIKIVRKAKLHFECIKNVTIRSGDVSIEVYAFVDTGNNLTDPVSGRQVCVAAVSLWERMERSGMISAERMRLVPYKAVGAKGILQAVRVDSLLSGGDEYRNCIIARNDSEFDCIGERETELLMGSSFVLEGREKC